jgi:xanthine dehydrogenase large subunit
MIFTDTFYHVRGESRFIDDHPLPEGLLYGALLCSPQAKGVITKLDCTAAEQSEGVAAVFTAADIPGQNQIGGIIADEPLLAVEEVHFRGQPVALVVADTEKQARKAVQKIILEITAGRPILDPREAFEEGEIIGTPRIFSCGEVEGAWKECDIIVEGSTETGGQEHLYLETQGALATLREDKSLHVISATQSPTHVQKFIAGVLGWEMHRVEVDVPRLGGAFGGKEDQATAWACMAGLAASKLLRPVKLVLHRHDDLRFTGKRHPYSSDYKLGLKKDGTMLAYEVIYYQNSGASADLSTAILERSMFHATGSYYIPNVKATGACCRTNLPPNTAFRGFGGPQAMFVLETAITKAADLLGMPPSEIQKKNLLREGDRFPFGMPARNPQAVRCFEEAETRYDLKGWRERIDRFNAGSRYVKKGLAAMPVCFGISFTNTTLNQAGALVHVYVDGSVSVSTGAVEMGQGVKQKILHVAASVFGIPESRVRLETTNTTRVANTSPTAASTGADLNGKATEAACRAIKERVLTAAAELLDEKGPENLTIENEVVRRKGRATELTWDELIREMYLERVDLSAHAHYATPHIGFDKNTEKGEPFAYHAFGTAFIEATVDCLRGTYRFDAVRAVHDAGKSLNPLIDLGQCEGGVVQGLGWLTMEDVVYNEEGRLLADMLSNYKIPDIYSAPEIIEVHFLEDSPNPMGVFNSKAIGEPPFMFALAGYFALYQAISAYRKEKFGGPETKAAENGPVHRVEKVIAPFTPEQVLREINKKQQ